MMATKIRDTVSKYCTLITTAIVDAVGIATIRLLLFSVVEVMQLHPLTATAATTRIKEDEEEEQQQIHCIESIMYLLQQYQLRDRIVLQYGWKAILLLTITPRTTLPGVAAVGTAEAPVTAPLLQPPLAPSLTHNNEKSNNSTNTTRSTSCIIIRRVEEDAKLVTTVMNCFPRNNMIHYLGCNALWSLIETRTNDADTTTASEEKGVSNSGNGTIETAVGVTKETKKNAKRGGWEAVIRGGAVSALLTILQCINTEKIGTTNKFGPCYFVTFLLLLVKNGEAANAAQQFVDLDGIPIVLRTVRMFGIGSMDTNNDTSTNKNIDKTNTDLICTSCLLIGYLIGCVVDGVATISAREILIRHNCIDIAIQVLEQNKHEMEIVRMCISLLRLLSSNGNDVMLVGTQQEQQQERHAQQQQQQQQHDLEEADSDNDGGDDSDLNRHERRRRRRRLTRNSEVSEQQPQQRHASFHEYGKEGADEDDSSKNKKRRRRQKRERWNPEHVDRNQDEGDVDKDSRIKKMKRHRRQHRQKRKKRQREQELKRMTIHTTDELIQFHSLYLLATAGNSTEAAMIRHQSIVVPVIVSAMQTYPNNEGMVLVCCLLFWKCLRNDTTNNHEALALLSSSGAIESVITATIAATRNNSNSNNDAAADNDVSVATIAYLLLTYVWDNRPLEQERATQAFGGNRRIISLITNL